MVKQTICNEKEEQKLFILFNLPTYCDNLNILNNALFGQVFRPKQTLKSVVEKIDFRNLKIFNQKTYLFV